MNRLIHNPFKEIAFPQAIEESLDGFFCVSCLMHPVGQYLAAGCGDGSVIIWDLTTRNVIKVLKYHKAAVTCLKWYRKSRFLLSGSEDGSVAVWDVIEGSVFYKIELSGPIVSADFFPSSQYKIFICARGYDPLVYDHQHHHGAEPSVLDNFEKEDEKSDIFVGCISRDFAYFGDKQGCVYVYDLKTKSLVIREKPGGSVSGIKQVKANDLDELLVSSNDRCIRLFQVSRSAPVLSLRLKIKDLVNRFHWSQVSFSGDNEYVVAGTMSKERHNVYIWDKVSGNLLKILEGPSEGLFDFSWHPYRPLVASVSSYGNIYIWTSNYEENWSAFAPDFKELEENLEYEEKEDEFDVVFDVGSTNISGDHTNKASSEAMIIDILSPMPQFNFNQENDMIALTLTKLL